jgi:hypothetical protein
VYDLAPVIDPRPVLIEGPTAQARIGQTIGRPMRS